MSQNIDLGGNTIVCEDIKIGATAPGQAGTSLSSTELTALDGASAANSTTGKVAILGTSGAVTFGGDITLGAGTTINLDSATATLSSNAATVTKRAVQVTSEALTTAAGASQAFVITLTGVAATDLAFVTPAGGTNTREHIQYKAICTSNTVTVTLSNIGPTNAVNGTVIFNLWVLKA
jgi:hypothetical protein